VPRGRGPLAGRTKTRDPTKRKSTVTKSRLILLSVCIACAVPVAHAGVALFAGRVGGEDVEGLAKFCEAAFGMQEVNRVKLPSGPELFLNFGDSVESAKANAKAPIAVMHRDSGAMRDPIAHLMVSVTDMAATVSAVKAAGGCAEAPALPIIRKLVEHLLHD
jgi:hypothetical protein